MIHQGSGASGKRVMELPGQILDRAKHWGCNMEFVSAGVLEKVEVHASRIRPASVQALAAISVLILIAAVSLHRLNGTLYEVSFGETFRQLRSIMPITVTATIKLWAVWMLGTTIIAGAILRCDPELGLLDSLVVPPGSG
jgi:hypothetical protein